MNACVRVYVRCHVLYLGKEQARGMVRMSSEGMSKCAQSTPWITALCSIAVRFDGGIFHDSVSSAADLSNMSCFPGQG